MNTNRLKGEKISCFWDCGDRRNGVGWGEIYPGGNVYKLVLNGKVFSGLS